MQVKYIDSLLPGTYLKLHTCVTENFEIYALHARKKPFHIQIRYGDDTITQVWNVLKMHLNHRQLMITCRKNA